MASRFRFRAQGLGFTAWLQGQGKQGLVNKQLLHPGIVSLLGDPTIAGLQKTRIGARADGTITGSFKGSL